MTGAVSKAGVLLALASLLVYNANLREISSADTISTRLLPVAVIRDHGVTLDRYFRDIEPTPYWVQRVGGHYVSSYPILPALLAVPVYLVPVVLFGDESWSLLNLLAKVSASLFAALSVTLVYLAARRVAPERHGPGAPVAVALIYAFGTSTWSVASQGLWGHGPAQLFMAAAIYAALRGAVDGRFFAASGLAAGLMVASRPTTILVAAALLAYGLRRDLPSGIRGVVGFGAATAPVVLYNVRYFGSLQGGYGHVIALQETIHGVAGAWSTPLGEGLLGLLLSPSRGLLVYSPILALAVVGVVSSVALPRGHLLHYLALGLGASLLVLGKYSVWWAGHSFGPRLLGDFLPALAVFFVPIWGRLTRRRAGRALVLVLFAVSVAVQLVGAFYYPSPREVDWNTSPRPVGLSRHRLWDWEDSQILRLVRNGPRLPGFGSGG
ncbi:MAG: hypothetical protein ACREMB_07595 [Candidatus Rokuibacteriota bacterium]